MDGGRSAFSLRRGAVVEDGQHCIWCMGYDVRGWYVYSLLRDSVVGAGPHLVWGGERSLGAVSIGSIDLYGTYQRLIRESAFYAAALYIILLYILAATCRSICFTLMCLL